MLDDATVSNSQTSYHNTNWLDQSKNTLCDLTIEIKNKGSLLRIKIKEHGSGTVLHTVVQAGTIISKVQGDLALLASFVVVNDANKIVIEIPTLI